MIRCRVTETRWQLSEQITRATMLCLIFDKSNFIFNVRKRSCGKVMLSQACVKNSVHRGRVCQTPPRADTHPPGQTTPPTPQKHTATAADGTHPTGIHSCLTHKLANFSLHDGYFEPFLHWL